MGWGLNELFRFIPPTWNLSKLLVVGKLGAPGFTIFVGLQDGKRELKNGVNLPPCIMLEVGCLTSS